MKYSDIKNLKPNRKCCPYDRYLKGQRNAIESHSLEHGQIFMPIFVWQGKDEIIYGQTIYEISKQHPELELTVIEIPCKDWREAESWIVDFILSQPSVSLWDKFELAMTCEKYWLLKVDAKKAQGTRNDLSSGAEGKLDSKEVNKIIASKVGCSATMVHYFKKICDSGKKDVIKKCSTGELSISTAYEKHIAPGNKATKPDDDPPCNVEVVPSSFFDDYQKDVVLGNKSLSKETAPDPTPIVDQMVKAKLPKGRLWISLNKKTGTIQLFRKIVNKDKGVISIKVDSFGCKIKESNHEAIIFEASYLNCGTAPYKRKDESDFEDAAA